jgi:tRNA(His) 5'-end guanylyltransferase
MVDAIGCYARAVGMGNVDSMASFFASFLVSYVFHHHGNQSRHHANTNRHASFGDRVVLKSVDTVGWD